MDEIPEQLNDWWKLDEPPERDAAFRFAVMEKIERRRFWSECSQIISMALAIGLVAWVVAPALESFIRNADAAFAATLAIGLILAWIAESGLDLEAT